jgi:nitrate/TMAO reductase-like tetraheme cytochrome c subunit
LKPDWLDLGGCDNPAPTAHSNNAAGPARAQCKGSHVSHAARQNAAQNMTAMRCLQIAKTKWKNGSRVHEALQAFVKR